MDNLTNCEAEILDAITSSFDPPPEADPQPQETENSIHNFTKILDEVGV
ncbi:hypothetical protein [Anabaena subtropica]|uniref:Uncharacterized protein n=1 Tax=Anabaena subtropica FACHB-260 TaxID=2692884 RepID=A0ABR8CMD6_9NOST|nr:hypothetical protein [Anabaena subtropica]MBD2344184.1 hypothetical protein [Anabaena subtropica FACHB-260]